MGKVRVEKNKKVVEYHKIKPVNPSVRGWAKIDVLDEQGNVVEKQESENLVKSAHIINNQSFYQEMARSIANGRGYVLHNCDGAYFSASDVSYMYLLDSNGVTGLEYDGLDMRIDTAIGDGTNGVLTQAYAKMGTVQATDSKLGTWVSTTTTYPSRNKKNVEFVCDFPLGTGNENSGNIDTIMLVAGNNVERDYIARRDFVCTKYLSNSTGKGLRNGASIYLDLGVGNTKYYGTCKKYDGEAYFCKDNADPLKTDVWVEDYVGQAHLLFETAIPQTCTDITLDHKKDGTIAIGYRVGGTGVFGYKTYQSDGTLIKENEATGDGDIGYIVTSYFDEDDKFYFVTRKDSGGGTKYHLNVYNTANNTLEKDHDTGVVNSYTSGSYSQKGTSMLKAKTGVLKFLCTEIGLDYPGQSTGAYTQGYIFDFVNDTALETHKMAYSQAEPTDFHDDTMYYNRHTDNDGGTPITTIDKATGLPYGISWYWEGLVYMCAVATIGKTNKQYAVNTISPITKTDQRTIRITYTIEEDYSGLALKDEITTYDYDPNIKL